MRFLFFGTPDYTTRYLDCLSGMGAVVGVVTAPDRPSGRGRGLHRPGPAIWAHEHGIPCFQPDSHGIRPFPGSLRHWMPTWDCRGLRPDFAALRFRTPRLETINVHFHCFPPSGAHPRLNQHCFAAPARPVSVSNALSKPWMPAMCSTASSSGCRRGPLSRAL